MKKNRLIFLSAVMTLTALVIAALILTNLLQTEDSNGIDIHTEEGVELRVDFIDVGKGDCILIRSKSHTLLIDTGYKDTADDVFNYLDAASVSEIDALIITHFDKDHMGGAKKLLSQYPVKKLYVPDYDKDSKKFGKLLKAIEKNAVPVEYVSGKKAFSADNIAYSVMPSGVSYDAQLENDNDMSLLVTVVNGKDSYLFTGDIEEEGIRRFLSNSDSSYDILKIPHHGRMENNSKALLDGVKPAYAVITDDDEKGADIELCLLLESAGVNYYCTSEKGTVTIIGNGSGKYCVKTEKTGSGRN